MLFKNPTLSKNSAKTGTTHCKGLEEGVTLEVSGRLAGKMDRKVND